MFEGAGGLDGEEEMSPRLYVVVGQDEDWLGGCKWEETVARP